MTIIWGRKAYDDLDGVANYLANQSPEAEETTISRIQKAVLMLGDFPGLGTKVDESGLRRLIVSGTPYVIFYRVSPEHVNIRAIFHTRQRRFLEWRRKNCPKEFLSVSENVPRLPRLNLS